MKFSKMYIAALCGMMVLANSTAVFAGEIIRYIISRKAA